MHGQYTHMHINPTLSNQKIAYKHKYCITLKIIKVLVLIEVKFIFEIFKEWQGKYLVDFA